MVRAGPYPRGSPPSRFRHRPAAAWPRSWRARLDSSVLWLVAFRCWVSSASAPGRIAGLDRSEDPFMVVQRGPAGLGRHRRLWRVVWPGRAGLVPDGGLLGRPDRLERAEYDDHGRAAAVGDQGLVEAPGVGVVARHVGELGLLGVDHGPQGRCHRRHPVRAARAQRGADRLEVSSGPWAAARTVSIRGSER
jgi:hypothetical protein